MSAEVEAKNVSGLRAYWDSPRGQERRRKQREGMFGNQHAAKDPVEKKRKSTSPLAGDPSAAAEGVEGEYLGADPHLRPGEKAKNTQTEGPAPELKRIPDEKIRKIWPKFLVRLHKTIERTFKGLQWGTNKVLARFYPDVQVEIKLDEYTPADAAVDAELDELLLDENLSLWISKNRFKAWMINRFVWIVGGIDAKIKKKEQKNGGAEEKPGIPGQAHRSGDGTN